MKHNNKSIIFTSLALNQTKYFTGLAMFDCIPPTIPAVWIIISGLTEDIKLSTASKFKNDVGWIWIDTFKKLPIKKDSIKLLNKFKTCLVCPERWGRPSDIKKYFNLLKKLNFYPNSVMTNKKYIHEWEKLILNS